MSVNVNKYAYVYLLMFNERYAEGVIPSIVSLKLARSKVNKHYENYNTLPIITQENLQKSYITSTSDQCFVNFDKEYIEQKDTIPSSEYDIDIVVMVTPDITQRVILELEKVADKIIHVDYIKQESVKLPSKKQQKYYDPWINKSYTKWRCLELINYKKVLFLDADIIVNENIDHLFELQAPAASFATPYYTPSPQYNVDVPVENNTYHSLFNDKVFYVEDVYKKGYYNKFQWIKHGTIVPYSLVNKTLQTGFKQVLWGSIVLLEPDLNVFKELTELIFKTITFGDSKSLSAVDEQSIAKLYISRKTNFTNIHHKYNFISWKRNYLFEKPAVIHMISPKKAWLYEKLEYIDMIPYFKMVWRSVHIYNVNLFRKETLSISEDVIQQ